MSVNERACVHRRIIGFFSFVHVNGVLVVPMPVPKILVVLWFFSRLYFVLMILWHCTVYTNNIVIIISVSTHIIAHFFHGIAAAGWLWATVTAILPMCNTWKTKERPKFLFKKRTKEKNNDSLYEWMNEKRLKLHRTLTHTHNYILNIPLYKY